MRVIAGSAGGLRLFVPKAGVRPTMDRVKAAIFSSLGEQVVNARVLDLFAGTGALGIEALSRGARSATFVEQNREAIAAIEQNLAQTGFSGRIVRQDVFNFLQRLNSAEVIDLIFADPPYDPHKDGATFTELLLRSDRLPSCLTDEGVFILEKRPGEQLPETDLWEPIRRKTYGATETIFFRRKSQLPEKP